MSEQSIKPTSAISQQLDQLWAELTEHEDRDNIARLTVRFNERARQYAALMTPEVPTKNQDHRHILVFEIDHIRYGIDVVMVFNVQTLDHVRRVPNLPSSYQGIIHVRGQLISVLDLHSLLDMPIERPQTRDEVIIFRHRSHIIALSAHYVEGVRVVSKADINAIHVGYAQGITRDQVLILDIDYLIDHEHFVLKGDT